MQARKMLLAAVVTFLNILSAVLFRRCLGSEEIAIMPTGIHLVLFGAFLLLVILLFHHYSFHLKEKYGFPLFCILFFLILFFIILFSFSLRLYFLLKVGLFVNQLLVVIFGVGTVMTAETQYGTMMMASSGDSGSSNSSSWTGKTSFEERVLQEPWPVTHNRGFEASMHNRISFLENKGSIFLLDKDKGVYWSEIKALLENCSSQGE